jgi:hypothetical protein
MTSLHCPSEREAVQCATARILLVWRWASKASAREDNRLLLMVERSPGGSAQLSIWRERGGDAGASLREPPLLRAPVRIRHQSVRGDRSTDVHLWLESDARGLDPQAASSSDTPSRDAVELSLVLRGGTLLYLRSGAPRAAALTGGTYELDRVEIEGLGGEHASE